jgi:hypothetical protein
MALALPGPGSLAIVVNMMSEAYPQIFHGREGYLREQGCPYI